MSLPKRDGVHDRYYLIHKPDTSLEVLAEADLCIQDVLNGTARENHSAYPTVVRNHNGTPFLPDQLLERYLTGLPLKGFPCEDAASLCDAMRRLVGWQEIRYTLEKYIEKLEAENSEIVDIVRGMSISLTELPLLFEKLKDGGTLGQCVPKSEEEKEEN